MKDLWALIKKLFSTCVTAFVIVWKMIKFLLVKVWRLVLIIFGAMFGIKLAKQAISKEE
jgi:hypothetical protein